MLLLVKQDNQLEYAKTYFKFGQSELKNKHETATIGTAWGLYHTSGPYNHKYVP